MKELWKPCIIKNYLISNLGNLKHIKHERVLKLETNKSGYKKIRLLKKNFYIHRLVGIAFLENPYNLPNINHMNGIRDDNRVENLEWVTQKINSEHSRNVTNNGLRISYGKIKRLYENNKTLSLEEFIKLILNESK